MNGRDVRADRHALLELDALLARIEALAADGDRKKFENDDHLRWVLHRLWIAVGNEALAYARLAGIDPYVDQPWARLYQLRNKCRRSWNFRSLDHRNSLGEWTFGGRGRGYRLVTVNTS